MATGRAGVATVVITVALAGAMVAAGMVATRRRGTHACDARAEPSRVPTQAEQKPPVRMRRVSGELITRVHRAMGGGALRSD